MPDAVVAVLSIEMWGAKVDDSWFQNRPLGARQRFKNWAPRWRSALVRFAEEVASGTSPSRLVFREPSAILHLDGVGSSIVRFEVVEPAVGLGQATLPSDSGMGSMLLERGPVTCATFEHVNVHVPSGLVQLPSGHVYAGVTGVERLAYLPGGAAQEVHELNTAGRFLGGAWAVIPSTDYFYHHLIDGIIPFLKLQAIEPSVQLLVPQGQRKWFYESIDCLGLRATVIPEKALRVEQLWHLDSAIPNSSDVALLRGRMPRSRRSMAGQSRRILITRRGLPRFEAELEDAVREEIEGLGFDVLDPGALSVADQMAIFANCHTIVAAHGGALTNMLWARAPATVVELFPKGFRGYQYPCLAKACGHNYSPLSPGPPKVVASQVRSIVTRL